MAFLTRPNMYSCANKKMKYVNTLLISTRVENCLSQSSHSLENKLLLTTNCFEMENFNVGVCYVLRYKKVYMYTFIN